ncbi:MFS transporter [Neobacillus sp. D3-1R]|uniref:MFS transporter n=1 Tax=Neobacillus sp. D3-1R TaxID=3445778 RepID=UPI003FA09BD7
MKRNEKGLLFLLGLTAFFIGLDSLVVSPLIPQILQSSKAPLELGGLLITVYALFYGVSAPLFGPISDRIGRKKMITVGMFIFSVGTFFTGMTTQFPIILVFRALTGLSGAMVIPSIFAFIGDTIAPEKKGRAMGIVMGSMIGSTVLGVPIGAFIANVTSWQWTFLIIGLFSIIIFGLNIIGLPKNSPQMKTQISPVKAYLGQFKRVFTNVSVLFALLATFLWTIGLHGMFSYIGVFYQQNFHLELDQLGIVIFLAGFASVVGNIMGGRWSDKVGLKKVIYIASFSAALFVFLFSWMTQYFLLAVVVHILWSAAIGFGQASLTSLIADLNPKTRGTVMSLNSSAMYLGMTFASGTASYLLVEYSFLAIGIFCALAALLVLPVISKVMEEKVEKSTVTLGQ